MHEHWAFLQSNNESERMLKNESYFCICHFCMPRSIYTTTATVNRKKRKVNIFSAKDDANNSFNSCHVVYYMSRSQTCFYTYRKDANNDDDDEHTVLSFRQQKRIQYNIQIQFARSRLLFVYLFHWCWRQKQQKIYTYVFLRSSSCSLKGDTLLENSKQHIFQASVRCSLETKTTSINTYILFYMCRIILRWECCYQWKQSIIEYMFGGNLTIYLSAGDTSEWLVKRDETKKTIRKEIIKTN